MSSDIQKALERVGAMGAVGSLEESRPHHGAARSVGSMAMIEWLGKQYARVSIVRHESCWVVWGRSEPCIQAAELSRNPFLDEALIVAVLATEPK